MCGRFALYSTLSEIKRLFSIDAAATAVAPRYNIAPGQEVAAIISHGGRRLGPLHWGLVSSWAQDRSGAAKRINARAETLRDKPSFKNLLARRRCAIPADGFFEWQRSGRSRQPYFIVASPGRPFAFAGLWDTWKGPGGASHHSCTIITTPACPQLELIHDRMPVVLTPAGVDAWLGSAGQDPAALEVVLRRDCVREFIARAVSACVNSPRNNGKQCIAPLGEDPSA